MVKQRYRGICSVPNCKNRYTDPRFTFFPIPKDVDRRNAWLKAIGREDLIKKVEAYNFDVCSAHFDATMINEYIIRKLLPNAVPVYITPEEVAGYERSKETNNRRFDESIQTTDSYISLLKAAKVASGETNYTGSLGTDDITERFYKLLKWQSDKRNKGKGSRFDPDFQQFAVNLRISCPKTYQALQSVLDLPSEDALARLNLNIRPEIEERVLNNIKLKLKSLPDVAKYCTLSLGQMAIKQHAYYNITRDEIIGFLNVNGYVRDELASNAYVIMLRGIAVDWTQPVAYALLADEDQLKELHYFVSEVITKLSSIGIKVKAIVSKHASEFQKYAKEFKQVSAERPYITFGDAKVYYLFDVPHMLISLRNHLRTNDFFYDENNISWSHIKEMYCQQKDNNLHLIPKITDDHVNPDNNQKVIVKYAAQIFSRSVYGALNTFVYMNYLPKEAKQTAEFVIAMNNLFDVLNSSIVVTENKYQRAFTGDKDQIAILNSAHEMFEQLTVANKTGNRHKLAIFENYRITMAATTLLSKDLKEEGISFMLTERLNQGPLESFFDTIKEQQSWRKPTSIQFKRDFSRLFLQHLLKTSSSTDNKEGLLDVLEENVLLSPLTGQVTSSDVLLGNAAGKLDYNFKVPPYNGITYVAAYLLMKCSKMHRCANFAEYLKPALNMEDTFPLFEGRQDSPFNEVPKVLSKTFLKYVSDLETMFVKHFEDIIRISKPACSMLLKFQEVSFSAPCHCFPTNYMLRLFVRFRIYNLLKYNNTIYRNRVKRLRYNLHVNSLL